MGGLWHRLMNAPEAGDRARALSELAGEAKWASRACRFVAVLMVLGIVVIVLFFVGLIVPKFIAEGASLKSIASAGTGFTGIELTTPERTATFTLVSEDGTTTIGKWLGYLCVLAALIVASRALAIIASTRSPFSYARWREMKIVGLLLVCAGLVAPLVGTLLTVLGLVVSGFRDSLSLSMAFEAAPLLAGLVVIVFGRIVDYGCILQEQDDRLL